VSKSSRMRVSTLSGSRRVTTTKGFFAGAIPLPLAQISARPGLPLLGPREWREGTKGRLPRPPFRSP
jgi:hypothetical protein